MSRLGLAPGIVRRHARSCPAFRSDDLEVCGCRPSYQAQAGPRRQRQTRTWPTLSAARAWKRDVDAAAARGELQGRAPLLRDAWKAWLVGAERGTILARGDKRYRPSTLRGYRQAMSMADGLMSVPLDKITRRLLAEHVQGLMERGLASQSVRNMMLPLRAVFRHAIDMEVGGGGDGIRTRGPLARTLVFKTGAVVGCQRRRAVPGGHFSR